MFLVKAGTVIQVNTPRSSELFNWVGWMPYTTLEDKYYDKEEVMDAVLLHNGGAEMGLIPDWAVRNIEMGKSVIQRNGRYAMINPSDLIYVD